ncbi:peroxiredoxin [Tumebacillus sp. BK434]|uniref:peroxiredoxin family protein n=1 Tax=Tumebacillus sp. BK434 TaxID=2512169 RepID=UPI00104A1ED4|nr:TlpA disulfide reductase family protein [Tumebacillus sp. BK434]TCP58092.1 peroxiredoxin [Tumebacillus sp. BK434]
MSRLWRSLLLVLTLALFLSACGDKDAPKAVPLKAGVPAPDFTLETMSGQTVKLSDLRGQKVFLNFWASWCPPCKKEMPDLQEMSRKYEDKVKLYGVNITADDTLERAETFILEQKLTFPQLLDKEGKVQKAYNAITVPISVTIDEAGKIVEYRLGQLTKEQMEQMFQALM